MLVLTRFRDQSIHIGDDVVVKVVDIRGEKIRIGITAPAHLAVHRDDIYERIQLEKKDKDTPTA